MKRRICATVMSAFVFFITPAAHAAQPPSWVATWGASPAPPPPQTPAPSSPDFNDETIRQIVRISVGGDQVRVRFSNEFGTKPLHIASAHLALALEGSETTPASDHVLTFGGRPTIDIPAGAPILSDPVAMTLAPLTKLAISLYIPDETGPCTCHGVGLENAYVVTGDATGETSLRNPKTLGVRAFLTGLDVAGKQATASIVALGDSITDGVMSTPNQDHRWPDRLAERLSGRTLGVVNEGISGNRLLAGGAGDSALTRFDRDVLATNGVRYLIVFEGINDLGQRHPAVDASTTTPLSPTAADLIGAYQQLIERAHAHGLKVFGATIVPYEGSGYYTPQGEADRQTINRWIRTSGAFDSVLDFDAIWRDPDHPSRIQAQFDSGDHIHGSDLGYKALADSIDLDIFR